MTLNWQHPQGCPGEAESSSGLSFGSIMLIIIAVVVFLYFAVGCPLMYFVFKKRGLEIIPFASFWLSIPSLIVEGVKFIISPCTKRGSYQTVA